MFGGDDDPFAMFSHMNQHMRQMDRMMNSMMDPFGGMGGFFGMGPQMGMIQGPGQGSQQRTQRSNQQLQLMDPFSPFGGLGIFGAMNQLQERAMNDPNAHVYTQSTMMTFGEDGRPRVVENSVRKAGDVKETRRRLQDGEREEISVGHHIGDRTHVIEKKRDKDGNMRKQQKFVNLDEHAAEDFDREFQSRVRRNMGYSGRSSNDRYAIGGVGGERPARRSVPMDYTPSSATTTSTRRSDNAPIITLPEEDDDTPPRRTSTARVGGPVIREISEEEAESSISKRARGSFGHYRD